MTGKKKTLQPIPAEKPADEVFFQSVAELIQQARRSLENRVNTVMVVTYHEIGRRIIEKEQQGAKRAQYGRKILQGLSDHLTATLGKGWSVHNLKLMRRFYVVYGERQIGQPVVTESETSIGEPLVLQFSDKIRIQAF